MLQYLIILLDQTSTSFCHYSPSIFPKGEKSPKPISLDVLRQGIRFGMLENLMIQFVYPDYELPKEYIEVIESIDHSKIKPLPPLTHPQMTGGIDADVLVLNVIKEIGFTEAPIVLRVNKQELFANEVIISDLLLKTPRLNIVLTDIETFKDEDFNAYKLFLERLSKIVEKMYVEGKAPQINLLTDRMMLKEMNNCGAGDTAITLAPNGKFYVCPAFYYEDETVDIGDLEHGLDIKNKQLYKLEYAPICRHCDAYQCKRCIWLNRKTTLEVNTPSHEQCVVAHIERNASRELLNNIRKHGLFLPDQEEIKEIDYLDPFEKRDEWNN